MITEEQARPFPRVARDERSGWELLRRSKPFVIQAPPDDENAQWPVGELYVDRGGWAIPIGREPDGPPKHASSVLSPAYRPASPAPRARRK